jgi:hypothetical protein
MPYTEEGMSISYLFKDADQAKSLSQIPLPATTTLADAETYAITSMGPLITAISSTQPYGMNIVYTRTRDGALNAGTGERERKGVFLVTGDARGQPTTRIEIPGISPAVMATDNKTINQNNALVAEFLQAILRGKEADEITDIVAGVTGCVSQRGYALVNSGTDPAAKAKSAYKYHRASGRGARRRSG